MTLWDREGVTDAYRAHLALAVEGEITVTVQSRRPEKLDAEGHLLTHGTSTTGAAASDTLTAWTALKLIVSGSVRGVSADISNSSNGARDALGVGDCVEDGVGDADAVAVLLAVWDEVPVKEPVAVDDVVRVGLSVGDGVSVEDAVSVCDGLAVELGVAVELAVLDILGVNVEERLPLCDCVAVTESDGVSVDVEVPDCDCV